MFTYSPSPIYCATLSTFVPRIVTTSLQGEEDNSLKMLTLLSAQPLTSSLYYTVCI